VLRNDPISEIIMRTQLMAFSTVLALSMLACAADSSNDSSSTSGAGEDLSKSGQLSQDLVCAAVGAVSDAPDHLKSVDEKALVGQALSDFKLWQKGMVSEFPSAAYELPVVFKGKTYTFWEVTEISDGGGCTGIYRTDGRVVSSYCAGESGDIRWSAPADKCSQ
jgi:hypothetical protein